VSFKKFYFIIYQTKKWCCKNIPDIKNEHDNDNDNDEDEQQIKTMKKLRK
jgi:hypothetical protein